ncbi:MAG TPA: tyrosine-type recombinase/integrase, partial [Acidimicrobiales bacterium]|nr:tyrosine-type recombinase/integrase [Acidimicrobiales bacterium]
GADEQLLCRYERHLVWDRGLVSQVVARYVETAALFLAAHPGLAAGSTVIGPAQVVAFCSRELPRRSPSVASGLASALRSFLRYLHLNGVLEAPLAQTVPAVARRPRTSLPRGLAPSAIIALLASCDRRSSRGRRDYAILLLLSRLGLRAGEVARLSLDDIDWRAGELTVHGKGGREDRLPLPDDVGAALAGYLRRGRPRTENRTVFLRAIAPLVALSPVGITWVVYSACERAGLAKAGAHRLRHSFACEVLRTGGSLIELGQALRHSLVATSAIYGKVDYAALAPLAQPWPGVRDE